jgi:tRNA/rRNA methyltransferase
MLQDLDRVKVVLVSPRNPLNIGAAARAMSNFGFSCLRIVNAYEVAYQEARSAVNASAVLAQSQQYPTVSEAVADCNMVIGTTSAGKRILQHPLRRLEYAAAEIRDEVAGEGTIALLFGSEKFGLSNEDLSYCHTLLRIPTRTEHYSMNLGQSVAVCLYELIRSSDAEQRDPKPVRRAPAGDIERLSDLLFSALSESGYVHKESAELEAAKLRRMIHRLDMTQPDAHIWLGMFRQILWKLRHASK